MGKTPHGPDWAVDAGSNLKQTRGKPQANKESRMADARVQGPHLYKNRTLHHDLLTNNEPNPAGGISDGERFFFFMGVGEGSNSGAQGNSQIDSRHLRKYTHQTMQLTQTQGLTELPSAHPMRSPRSDSGKNLFCVTGLKCPVSAALDGLEG